jgi:hypothetical protein
VHKSLLNVVLHDQFDGHNSERPPVDIAERTQTTATKNSAKTASKVSPAPMD